MLPGVRFPSDRCIDPVRMSDSSLSERYPGRIGAGPSGHVRGQGWSALPVGFSMVSSTEHFQQSSSWWGMLSTGSEWIVCWTEVGASLNPSQGFAPKGKDWFSLVVRAAKYGE